MDEALVEHPQHDVHRDDRGDDQQQLVVERGAERRRATLHRDDEARRKIEVSLDVLDGGNRSAER